jgi:hypothetical protein
LNIDVENSHLFVSGAIVRLGIRSLGYQPGIDRVRVGRHVVVDALRKVAVMSSKFTGRKRGTAVLASVFLAAGVLSIAGSMPAQAAVIPNPVLNITVSPPNPRLTDPVRTDIQWCVPDSATAGDTFEIALPPELTQLPRGFGLRDPNGVLVAVASIVGTPAVATFTFNDYIDTHLNVCGTAFFESRLDQSLVPGTTVTLTYVVNHTNTFTPTITIRPGTTTIGRDTAKKGAFFDDVNDECRTVATACLGWFIESALGPFQSVTINDAAAPGTSFECSRVTVRLWSVNGSGQLLNSFDPASAGTTVTITCTPSTLQVVGTNVPSGRLLRVLVRATPQQLIPDGGVTFVNSAQVTHVLPNSTVRTDDLVASRRSALVGGDANGVVPPTTTTTTIVGALPPDTTTTIVAALPPVPPPTIAPPPPGAQLPATGSNGLMLDVGLAAFLAGIALVIVAARRPKTV